MFSLDLNLDNQGLLIAKTLFEALDDGVVLIDAQGIIRGFNTGASRLTGHQADRALNVHFDLILDWRDRHGQALKDNPVACALKDQVVIRNDDLYLITPSKQKMPVCISCSPLQDAQEFDGLILLIRDMTDWRQREEEKTDFVSTASHEMRTPLATIEGYLSLAIKEPLDPTTMTYIKQARLSTLHLGKLFKDLLTTSQSEDGSLPYTPAIIDLIDFLRHLVKQNFGAKEKNLSLSLKVPSGKAEIYADADRLRELFINLIDNAVKYTQKGSVIIELTTANQAVQVEVRDTGRGIGQADLAHIFNKFYRLDNTTAGTGLGLFICQKIIELCGGSLWVESRLGEGSSFFVSFPQLSLTDKQQLMVK